MERRNAWLSYTEAEEKELEQVAKAYRNFLNVGKTERECVTQIIREARAAGYESLEEKTAKGEKLKAGDKVYTVGMKKIIALFHIGQDDISEGMNILGAHIDSPRLDVKQMTPKAKKLKKMLIQTILRSLPIKLLKLRLKMQKRKKMPMNLRLLKRLWTLHLNLKNKR